MRKVVLLIFALYFSFGAANALPGFLKSSKNKQKASKTKVKEEGKVEEGVLCHDCGGGSEATQLIFEIEERDIRNDQINRYEIFGNGLLIQSLIHEGNASRGDLYQSDMKLIGKKKVLEFQKYLKELQALEYFNFFPWKEDYYERGNVVKFKFPGLIRLDCFDKESSKCPEALISKVYIYYTGHTESPQLFAEILNFVKGL